MTATAHNPIPQTASPAPLDDPLNAEIARTRSDLPTMNNAARACVRHVLESILQDEPLSPATTNAIDQLLHEIDTPPDHHQNPPGGEGTRSKIAARARALKQAQTHSPSQTRRA